MRTILTGSSSASHPVQTIAFSNSTKGSSRIKAFGVFNSRTFDVLGCVTQVRVPYGVFWRKQIGNSAQISCIGFSLTYRVPTWLTIQTSVYYSVSSYYFQSQKMGNLSVPKVLNLERYK